MKKPAAALASLLSAAAIAGLVACAVTTGGEPDAGNGDFEQDIGASRSLDPAGAIARETPPELPGSASAADGLAEAAPAPALAPAAPSQPGDAQAGHRFALENCRPCHVVAADQASPVRFADAPSFRTVADDPRTTAIGLRMWLTNPHPSMPTLVLSAQESADVVAYLLSLRDRR